MQVTSQQQQIISAPPTGSIFLEGAAGTGKTTAGTGRLRYLLESGVSADTILVLVPQRALSLPYRNVLQDSRRIPGGQVTIHTIGSLSQAMVDLFFPLIAETAGFGQPLERPQFLSLETAQYYMQRVIGAVIDEKDYFASVTIQRSRLYSQIIDNLNKAAVVGFPHTEIGEKLKGAYAGEISQRYIYDEAQDCANTFRQYCLDNNLLDFSLQVEIFMNGLWTMDAPRRYLQNQFKHLIVDNVEEDNPATHTLIADWLPEFDSALVIYDTDAGFRRFLGSDANSAYHLKPLFDQQIQWSESHVMPPALATFAVNLAQVLHRPEPPAPTEAADLRTALDFKDHRYHPEMLDGVAEEIAHLIHEQGIPASEIVVLAPFLSDALRFALMTRLQDRDVPVRSHRPSRPLNAEPAARALLTLAQLAHPGWNQPPTPYDLAYALTNTLAGFDIVRAQLLVKIVYRKATLNPFADINPEMQQRITYEYGERFEALRHWLLAYQAEPIQALDFFMSRLFGELLSQPGYSFHGDFDAARVAANLIDSAQQFRWIVEEDLGDINAIGQEYMSMVTQGVIANQYIRDWEAAETESVLLAPAFTFLMGNQPVAYQFWLNVGSGGWWERLYQPLTHPYVLSLDWEAGRIWTDADEFESRQDTLYRLVLGLLRRCRGKIYLGYSQLGEQGYEQRGPLLEAIQRVLRRLASIDRHAG